MLTHGNFMFELTVAIDELDAALRAVGATTGDGASTLLFLPAGPRLRPDHPGRLRQGARADGPLGRHQEPARRLRRVPADVHPRGAPGLREGVQHRLPARRRRRAAARSSTGPPTWRSPGRAAWRAGRPEPRRARPAPALRPAGLRQAARGARRPAARTPSPAAPRSASGSATSTAASGSTCSRATGSPRPPPR